MTYDVNISKGLPGRVKDFYLGNTNVFMKTIKNQYFSVINLHDFEGWGGSNYGNKRNYYLASASENPKFNTLEIFNDFPMEIKNIFEFNIGIIQGNRPFTKEIQKKLDDIKKKYTEEKYELKSQVLRCKRCNRDYFEFQNTNTSCKFHLTDKKCEVKFYDTEIEVYECCCNDYCCQKAKHTQ